jgi:hypothetical protein
MEEFDVSVGTFFYQFFLSKNTPAFRNLKME